MNASNRPIWFVGDLDDPWVAAIADAVPGPVTRVACAGEWGDGFFQGLPSPATLLVHRAILTAQDAERLARLRRERPGALRVVLCVGPQPRYADVERWSALSEVVLPEATARETIARHAAAPDDRREGGRGGPRPRVDVVSGNYELRLALTEACHSAGYIARAAVDCGGGSPAPLCVWDVPLLEPGWPRTLARRSRTGLVVALLGFADRALVRQARSEGASACLELPCDPADLVDVLDRLSASRPDPVHEVPPAPLSLRRGPRAVAEPGPDTYN